MCFSRQMEDFLLRSIAIDRMTPATVVCVAIDAPPGRPASSGVIVSRTGLVLSDADAGATMKRVDGKWTRQVRNVLEVRVPDLARGSFKPYPGKVVHRDTKTDSALIQMQNVPAVGFPDLLVPGRSEGLRVRLVDDGQSYRYGCSLAFIAGNCDRSSMLLNDLLG